MLCPDPPAAVSNAVIPVVPQIIENETKCDDGPGRTKIGDPEFPGQHQHPESDKTEQQTGHDIADTHQERRQRITGLVGPASAKIADDSHFDEDGQYEKRDGKLGDIGKAVEIRHRGSPPPRNQSCPPAPEGRNRQATSA